jgi:histone H3/H4
MEFNENFWRVCSTCKKPIAYSGRYYECNVSTCSGKRTGYVFCSVPCWESHLPQARHRDAWAVEKVAPTKQQAIASGGGEDGETAAAPAAQPRRIIVSGAASPGAPNLKGSRGASSSMDHEVLVVVSKMKQYIKDKADMNTSADVADILSQLIRYACNDAMDEARADGRKTVMAKDFKGKA